MKVSATLIGLIALFATAQADASDFPSFDIFHSHCYVEATFPGQLCKVTYDNLSKIVVNFNSGSDPSHGQYIFKEK